MSGWMTRWMIPLLALTACASEAPTSAHGSRDLVVTRGALTRVALLTGELEAVSSDGLTAPRTRSWSVQIRWMEQEGSSVKQGQRVLEFDNAELVSELEEKRLAELRASNELTRQDAENAITTADKQIEVKRRHTALEKAKLDAAVPADVFPARVVQENQLALQRAESAYQQAKDDLDAQLQSAALDSRIKQIELETARRDIASAERALDALVLRAPRDGILLVAEHPWEGRKFQVGDTVWPGMTILKIPDLSLMQVKATLSDVDDGRIHAGMTARCVLDAFPDRSFQGTIKQVSPVAQEPSRKSLRRAFNVIVTLDETDVERMIPGMSVKVEVTTGEARRDVVIAPRGGLDITREPARAYLRGGGSVEVELGACNAHACEIVRGLDEGTKLREFRAPRGPSEPRQAMATSGDSADGERVQ